MMILGDCLALLPAACPAPAAIVTDPPYGTAMGDKGYLRSGIRVGERGAVEIRHSIAGDDDTTVRDALLALYPDTPAIVFGSPLRPPPPRTVQALVYVKPPNAGAINARGGWRRDIEMVFLVGPWPQGAPVRSSVLTTGARSAGGPGGNAARRGHPHAKPVDVLAALIATCPPGLILDPFAGSGTTLLAARMLDRPAVGIEVDPGYHAVAEANLAQMVLA